MIKCAYILLATAAISPPASAQIIVGRAVASDGDSLRISEQAVRLFGIDAPELAQTCDNAGVSWNCGSAAKDQLAALVDGRTVECSVTGTDVYGRSVAICTVGYLELNRTMVEKGWATAYRAYSTAYVSEEIRAKASKAGLWSSQFDLPENFRNAQRPDAAVRKAQTSSPRPRGAAFTHNGSCTIKGNRNRKGQWIYHLPGMPYYDATRAEEIFCSEVAAQRAGYRRAIVR